MRQAWRTAIFLVLDTAVKTRFEDEILNHEKAEEHPAQVREVRHAVAAEIGYTQRQFG